MSKSKHTPTPWRTGSLQSYNAYTGEREMFIYRLAPTNPEQTAENRICVRGSQSMNCVDDAEFIVTAVNEHDRLTAENARLREMLNNLVSQIEQFGEWDDGCFYYHRQSASELEEPLEKAHAILAETKESANEKLKP